MTRKTRINTVEDERQLLADAETTLDTGRARVVCERFRYRARRGVDRAANFNEARADIQRIADGVL